MRRVLLATVGTSLFNNFTNISENSLDKPDNWQNIKDHFDQQNWPQFARALADIPPDSRWCGAEINTVYDSLNKNWLDLQKLVFFVSDTDKGRNTGEVLKTYFRNKRDFPVSEVEVKPVQDLQDHTPKLFKTRGLRNLVRALGDYIQRNGNKEVAIDATGGYKAQIAIAVLIGQALNIPVYYKHELFSEIIDFPPLPVSMDFDILGNNAGLLSDFENGGYFESSELESLDEKLKVFLDEVEIDGSTLYELNAIGQLYLTTFHIRYPKASNLRQAGDEERNAPTFGDDHHYPNGFKQHVEKVWNENRWITTCNSLPYNKQRGIKRTEFYVSDTVHDNRPTLVGNYLGNDYGARFEIRLTDESRESLNWAAVQLNQKYKN